MSSIATQPATDRQTRPVLAGVLTAAAAVVLVAYSAYGDPHSGTEQKNAVPYLAIASVVVAALVFPLLLPRLSREASRRWSVVTGAIAVAASLVAFWAGVPLVLGVVAAIAGRRNRSTASVVLGVAAVGISISMAIVGNTILTTS